MKKILALDTGFGDNKVTFGTSDGTIQKIFKFPSIIALTNRDDLIKDTRIYEYKGRNYYIGDDALNMPSNAVIDITDYKNLEYFAPLFLYKVVKEIGEMPDVVVCGLSKAHLGNSGYFKEAIQNFTVNGENIKFENIFLLPQGAGSKLTVDYYGNDFPNPQTTFQGDQTYLGIDLGFNTVDVFLVTNGKTSPNLFEGIENQGVMKLAQKIRDNIQLEHAKEITLHEAKNILDTGYFKLRGTKHDKKDLIKMIKEEYLKELLKLTEERYGNSMDKCDFIFLSGGGSAFFESSSDNYIRCAKNKPEYYNSIGYYLFGKNC